MCKQTGPGAPRWMPFEGATPSSHYIWDREDSESSLDLRTPVLPPKPHLLCSSHPDTNLGRSKGIGKAFSTYVVNWLEAELPNNTLNDWTRLNSHILAKSWFLILCYVAGQEHHNDPWSSRKEHPVSSIQGNNICFAHLFVVWVTFCTCCISREKTNTEQEFQTGGQKWDWRRGQDFVFWENPSCNC